MASYSFNLIEQKWIPCIMLDGALNELGLLETLVKAHEIREIFDPSPLITASMHRLLLAILHRIFGPHTIDEWKTLWDAYHFDQVKLKAYFHNIKWYDRFDLFHEKYPFYQIANFGDKKSKPVTVNDLLPEQARGNNPTLFDHTTDAGCIPLAPEIAARGLPALYAFKLGGLSGLGQNFVDAPSARNILFLVRGENLFKTLMLNLLRYDADKNEPIPGSREDCPAWEQEHELDSNIPKGYLDYLTWQTLSLRLRPDNKDADGIKIINMDMALGRNLKNEDNFFDPAVAYRKDKKRGWLGLRFREDKALWRDSVCLFHLATENECPPGILRWIALLVQRRVVGRSLIYRMDAYGMCTNHAKIEFWRHEQMPLPLAYLADESLVKDLGRALKQGENVSTALNSAMWKIAKDMLVTPERKGEREKIQDLVGHLGADRLFWSRLETPFYRLLPDLPQDREKALNSWIATLRRTAWEAFDSATRDLDWSARTLKALVEARQTLNSGISQVLK